MHLLLLLGRTTTSSPAGLGGNQDDVLDGGTGDDRIFGDNGFLDFTNRDLVFDLNTLLRDKGLQEVDSNSGELTETGVVFSSIGRQVVLLGADFAPVGVSSPDVNVLSLHLKTITELGFEAEESVDTVEAGSHEWRA